MSDYDPDEATARADFCRFLSACYYEPAVEFAEEKLFDNMLIAARRIRPELADFTEKLGAAFTQSSIETLLVDYTRLFLGPMEPLAKPYGASWLETAVDAEENPHLAVLDIYHAGGFDIDEGFQELPDHIAVELEFLYVLIFNSNMARLSEATESQADVEQIKQQFLGENLSAWIDPFASAVKAHAQADFYGILVDCTRCFVQLESGKVALH
jgi:TorA maturation chaperone TorD